jgi:hypothetical protein
VLNKGENGLTTQLSLAMFSNYLIDNTLYRKIQQHATVYQNLLFRICMKLNMFLATHRPSSGT